MQVVGRATQLEQPVGYVLKQLQHALRGAMDQALRAHGLTTPQYSALTAMASTGELSGAELARRTFVTAQTMNGIIVNLETAGLVTRRPDSADARVLRAELTATGRARLQACDRAVEAIERRMVSDLRPDERRWFRDALGRCVTALSANPRE